MPIRRNSHGRFRSRSRRTVSATAGRVLRMSSPSQYRAVESLIRKGPMTIMLVYSPSCPHCHTYMPLWKEMCAMKRRRANLVSMEASTYDETPMAKSQPVSGVPTVLFVDKHGRVTEALEPRNRTVMSEAVSRGVSEVEAAMAPPQMPSPAASVSESSEPLAGTEMPAGTTIMPNPLEALPAQPVRSESSVIQYGGNPWAAFLATAAQAAPAAVLAGAYAISKARRRTVRSSGLPAPEHSAKWRRLRSKLMSRRRR
jgi:hypothetical protein